MSDVGNRLRSVATAFRNTETFDPSIAAPVSNVPEMLGLIGSTLLASAQATSDVEVTLNRLAGRYGRPDLRTYVLPTVVLIEDPSTTPTQTNFFPAPGDALRLDQTGMIQQLVDRAFRERTDPATLGESIWRARMAEPRFGPAVSVLGYVLLTVGFGLVLNPALSALPLHVLLGFVVGVIFQVGSRISTLALILPVVTAFSVTVLVAGVARPIVHDDVLRLVAPSLVAFLPGLPLTIAAVELTSGQIIAGASRMVYGLARLGLLAFGVFAGLSVSHGSVAPRVQPELLGPWAPWAGIVLVSLGFYLYSAAPRGSLLWILFALVVAYSGQLLGDWTLGAVLSGSIGAMIAIPVVSLASRVPGAPPAGMLITCAFWLLVPGALGFIGVSQAASGAAGAAHTLLQTFGSLVAIAIGMMLGAGFTKDAGVAARAWRTASAT